MNRELASTPTIGRAYALAKTAVVEAGYADEIVNQRLASLSKITESTFLRESAWVVLSCGLSNRVVASVFPRVSKCFLYWSSAYEIRQESDTCVARAFRHFGHLRKLEAIATIADYVAEVGVEEIASRIATEGPEALVELPYVGPVTSKHLAKNLGFQTAKPDRHLLRMASSVGRESPEELCLEISDFFGESVAVVDLVLWRYGTLYGSQLPLK